jgi:hypothetical protein
VTSCQEIVFVRFVRRFTISIIDISTAEGIMLVEITVTTLSNYSLCGGMGSETKSRFIIERLNIRKIGILLIV